MIIIRDYQCPKCKKIYTFEHQRFSDEPLNCKKCNIKPERYHSAKSVPHPVGEYLRKKPYDYLNKGLPEEPIRVTVPDNYKGVKNGRRKTKG